MTKNKDSQVCLAVVLVLLCTFNVNIAAAASLAVITSTENQYIAESGKTRQLLKRLFLKQSNYWPSKVKAFPIARAEDSMESQIFRKAVLKMSHPQLKRHWLQMKQKSGKKAPPAIRRTESVLRAVISKPGAFAVVNLDEIEKLPKTVRVVMKFGNGKK